LGPPSGPSTPTPTPLTPHDKFMCGSFFRVPRIRTCTDTGGKGKRREEGKKKQKEMGVVVGAGVSIHWSRGLPRTQVPSPSPAFFIFMRDRTVRPPPLVRIWFAAGWLPTPSSTNSTRMPRFHSFWKEICIYKVTFAHILVINATQSRQGKEATQLRITEDQNVIHLGGARQVGL
jgi:hypothetical protein